MIPSPVDLPLVLLEDELGLEELAVLDHGLAALPDVRTGSPSRGWNTFLTSQLPTIFSRYFCPAPVPDLGS